MERLRSQLDSLMEIKDYIDEDQFDYERLSLNPKYINEILVNYFATQNYMLKEM